MDSRSAYDLIYIGLNIRHLQNITSDISCNRVIKLLKNLREHLEGAELKTSISGYDNFIGSLIENLEKKNEEEQIGKAMQVEISEKIMTIEKIVFSESSITEFYVIPERRYNKDYLLTKPMNLLKQGVFAKLPEMAIFDFTSSCKCLLYGEGTASAFHILRATEETLKHYYYKYKRTQRLAKPMWGPMTSQLRSKPGKKPSDNILNALDLVRVSYRNPTQHPEVRYSIEEAQDLFGVCIDLINKMGDELKEK